MAFPWNAYQASFFFFPCLVLTQDRSDRPKTWNFGRRSWHDKRRFFIAATDFSLPFAFTLHICHWLARPELSKRAQGPDRQIGKRNTMRKKIAFSLHYRHLSSSSWLTHHHFMLLIGSPSLLGHDWTTHAKKKTGKFSFTRRINTRLSSLFVRSRAKNTPDGKPFSLSSSDRP